GAKRRPHQKLWRFLKTLWRFLNKAWRLNNDCRFFKKDWRFVKKDWSLLPAENLEQMRRYEAGSRGTLFVWHDHSVPIALPVHDVDQFARFQRRNDRAAEIGFSADRRGRDPRSSRLSRCVTAAKQQQRRGKGRD